VSLIKRLLAVSRIASRAGMLRADDVEGNDGRIDAAHHVGQRLHADITADDLGAARIDTVRRHMALECAQDWDGVLATFAHPRYELYGSGTVFDGEAAVRQYFTTSRIPFPDQGNEIIAIAAADEVVLVEFWLTGTHSGPLRVRDRVHPPTGKRFRVRMAAAFEFAPGSDEIVCERPYFDTGAVLRALDLR
jgi:hypothetical protein